MGVQATQMHHDASCRCIMHHLQNVGVHLAQADLQVAKLLARGGGQVRDARAIRAGVKAHAWAARRFFCCFSFWSSVTVTRVACSRQTKRPIQRACWNPRSLWRETQTALPPLACASWSTERVRDSRPSDLRSNASSRARGWRTARELYAYDSIVADPNDPSALWFYYTYLLPGETFSQRYLVRRSVTLEQHTAAFRASRVVLMLLRGSSRDGRLGDWWATSAVVPAAENYTQASEPALGAVLVTGGPGRKRLTDCFISQWGDHFIANDGECNSSGTVNLRTLGFALDDSGAAVAKAAGVSTVPLFRCFDNATKNHAVSLSQSCDGKGRLEFSLGHIVAAGGSSRPAAPLGDAADRGS